MMHARTPLSTLLLLSCQEFGLDPIDPDGPPPLQAAVSDVFVQAPLPAVDLLFVVDGTPSMAQELDALAGGVPALVETLDSFGLDWQIGVVGADRTGSHPGWLLGSPYVITRADEDVGARFAERLPLGEADDEAGLAAAALALELADVGGANAGFRRMDAALQVVFVSDADDASDAWLADPVPDFLAALSAQDRPDRPARAAALVGPVPGGCVSASGSAQPGARYAAVAEATGGRTASICEIDFGGLLADLASDSVTLPARFPLEDEPVPSTVQVEVDGSRRADGWTLAWDGGASVVFDDPPAAGSVIVVRYVVREERP